MLDRPLVRGHTQGVVGRRWSARIRGLGARIQTQALKLGRQRSFETTTERPASMPVAPRSSGSLALAADSMPSGCPYPVPVHSRDPLPIEPTGGFAASDSLETEIEFGPTTSI